MTLNQSSTWPTYSYERYQIIAYKTGWIILLNALRITDSKVFFFFFFFFCCQQLTAISKKVKGYQTSILILI
uniref:Uncharacterized protein n=1 Tax=Brassica oleracea var. oleracea TaxID=109376 RepID=A0A0D3ABX2_BRAOL